MPVPVKNEAADDRSAASGDKLVDVTKKVCEVVGGIAVPAKPVAGVVGIGFSMEVLSVPGAPVPKKMN